MEKIKLESGYLYRASKGKKVKFINSESTFSEIVVKKETDKIVEVGK